jgi:DNA ligase
MVDLLDGDSVEVQGSASRPYVLKNIGGVYSCSCPAWRNQSLPIDRRTCKHLRQLRGDEVEIIRIGSQLTATAKMVKVGAAAAFGRKLGWRNRSDGLAFE